MAISKVPENNMPAGNIDQIDEIKPLKIETVNGFRARIKSILEKWLPLLFAGGVTGSAVGGMAQHEYRDFTGYDPNKIQKEETDNKDREQKEENKENEPKGLMAKALQKLKRAKDWTVDKVNQTKIVQEYKKSVKELKEMYRKMLDIGDKVSFWLPFLLTFLATVTLANKAIKLKKTLTERVDPVVERNMQLMEGKTNELITRVNAISNQNFVSAQQQMEIMSEIQKLMKAFESQEAAVGKEISETTEPKLGAVEPKKDIAA